MVEHISWTTGQQHVKNSICRWINVKSRPRRQATNNGSTNQTAVVLSHLIHIQNWTQYSALLPHEQQDELSIGISLLYDFLKFIFGQLRRMAYICSF